MDRRKNITRLLVFILGITQISFAATNDINIVSGKWKITYHEGTKKLDYIYNNEIILAGVTVNAKNGNVLLNSFDYSVANYLQENISDNFGNGEKYTIRFSGLAGQPDLEQIFYFYADKNYFLTEAYIHSNTFTSSNYIAPIVTSVRSSFLPTDESNRVLSVPFDNDDFVRYSSFPLSTDSVSFEVTSIYNGPSRRGLVIGSVEHNVWKTGIRYSTTENQYIDKLECFGGITHKSTRDVDAHNVIIPHGSIKGTDLKSPKIFVGLFEDWRRGMEEYGTVNAIIAPPRTWTKGTPFGWNSWGGMETKVNYDGVVDVSDFLKNELQSRNFENNGQTYIGLDSWWNDNFSVSQLRGFVAHCNANGQEAGIYWGPFSDWGGDGERVMEGTNGQYKYKDAYLYANGEIRSIQARSLDPTHPATKMLMEYYIDRFKKWGFKYIKLDFINNGIVEADSFYVDSITTGVQAYNYGMRNLVELCGDDMYLALSIAPTFPAQYGHSKRISCDTWGQMGENIGETGYELNSLSFGWWLDRVYTFNDADHLVLDGYSAGANRARITSGVITGIYMLGDNLSQKGSFPGTQTALDKNLMYATNADINDIARLGKSFYPVEGYLASAADKSENFFMLDTEKYIYFVVFNFNAATTKKGNMALTRLGIDADNVSSIKELWTGSEVEITDNSVAYSVPFRDVRVYRILKKNAGNSIIDTKNTGALKTYISGDNILQVECEEPVSHISMFSVNGRQVLDMMFVEDKHQSIQMSDLPKGVYLIKAETSSGKAYFTKILK